MITGKQAYNLWFVSMHGDLPHLNTWEKLESNTKLRWEEYARELVFIDQSQEKKDGT
jgi:hypothetical protein